GRACLGFAALFSAALFSAALFSFVRVLAALLSAALFSFVRVVAALLSAALFSVALLSAALFSAVLFSFVRIVAALLSAAGALYGAPASLAATAPEPLNSPGFAVAATAGRPWFTDAKSSWFVLAACTCWVCIAVAGVCCWCIAVSSAAVGRAISPPSPPL